MSRHNKLGHLETEVSEVTSLLRDNVEKVVDRGEKINDLQDRTDDLSASAVVFRKSAVRIKRRMCCQNFRMTLILILVVVAIIGVIVIVLVVEHPWDSSNSKKKNSTLLSIVGAKNNELINSGS